MPPKNLKIGDYIVSNEPLRGHPPKTVFKVQDISGELVNGYYTWRFREEKATDAEIVTAKLLNSIFE